MYVCSKPFSIVYQNVRTWVLLDGASSPLLASLSPLPAMIPSELTRAPIPSPKSHATRCLPTYSQAGRCSRPGVRLLPLHLGDGAGSRTHTDVTRLSVWVAVGNSGCGWARAVAPGRKTVKYTTGRLDWPLDTRLACGGLLCYYCEKHPPSRGHGLWLRNIVETGGQGYLEGGSVTATKRGQIWANVGDPSWEARCWLEAHLCCGCRSEQMIGKEEMASPPPPPPLRFSSYSLLEVSTTSLVLCDRSAPPASGLFHHRKQQQ